ncbi:MAG: ATP-binding protein [Fusobacterium sp.]|nr:ATP-binding protein [Fusobacterium sp.]
MEINEIVVISGKGGTGKTTITSSLIPYFKNVIIGDCDVDAPNLKILFDVKNSKKESFFGMKKASLNKELCIQCGKCYEACRFNAIENPKKCESCSICEWVCPVGAIKMIDNEAGEIFTSDTKYGKMIYAGLFPGEENSGKLVAEVRKKAKKLAQEENKKYIILDGAPGVACNVISSLTGVKKVVVVTEPTLSGLHDLERVLELIERFRIKPYFVINKYDLSKEISQKIEEYLKNKGFEVAIKMPFDRKIVKAIAKKEIPSVVEKDFFDQLGFKKLVQNLQD